MAGFRSIRGKIPVTRSDAYCTAANLMDWWPFVVSAACAGMLMPLAIHATVDRPRRASGRPEAARRARRRGWAASSSSSPAPSPSPWSSRTVTATRCVGLPLVLAVVPVVLFGLAEDLTRSVRPRYRMAAAVLSAMRRERLFGRHRPAARPAARRQPPPAPVVRAAADVVHGGRRVQRDQSHRRRPRPRRRHVRSSCSAASRSRRAGRAIAATLTEALVVMGALVGFLFWNYPRGRVFLGDAGAYFLGFMYAELSIQLVARNSGISAWYVIMLAGYPIVDTLFAMYRRGVVRRVPLMAPDALHLHSLVFRRDRAADRAPARAT